MRFSKYAALTEAGKQVSRETQELKARFQQAAAMRTSAETISVRGSAPNETRDLKAAEVQA